MNRWPLVEMLSRYRDRFPEEASVVDRIVALVESRADCFDRTCRPGHVTASAWILSSDRQRVLLTHHAKLNRWLQLGGHADGQWQIEEAALREAREESGLVEFTFAPFLGSIMPFDIDVHEIPTRHDAAGNLIEDAHEHHDIRFLLIARGDEICVSDESHDVRWFTPEEVRTLTNETSVLRMLEKALTWLA
ncbi:MAG: NUDIX hydrolase [Pirellulales bacterium]|nr:NUDIX hydrolase [Pirellulales bacterium]